MVRVKNIVYQFPDNGWPDDVEIDRTGTLRFSKGDFIVEGGITWKVDSITIEYPINQAKRNIHWVHLVYACV
jgi:hypothetical protein